MRSEVSQRLTDEQIVDEICRSKLWASPWYFRFSNFLVNYYLAICLVPPILLARFSDNNMYYIAIPILLHDLLWGKGRIPIRWDKKKFIQTYLFELKHEKKFTLKPIISIIVLATSNIILFSYYGYYFPSLVLLMMYVLFAIFEYRFVEKYEKYLINMGISSELINSHFEETEIKFIRFKVVSIGGFGYGGFIYNRYSCLIYLSIFWFFYTAMTSFAFTNLKTELYDRLQVTFFLLLILLGFLALLFATSLTIRAREVAQKYLGIIEENGQ